MKARSFFFALFALLSLAFTKELYRIRVENKQGGKIEISENRGENYYQIGTVLLPAKVASSQMYKAATFARPSRVSATAVNAIHIALPDASGKKVGSIFSLLPKEFYVPPQNYNSYLQTASSLITDIPAGETIFGGGYAPFVGNSVLDNQNRPLTQMVALDQFFVILVTVRKNFPTRIEFENKFGGKVMLFVPGKKPRVIAQVLRPVQGVGRFTGTTYTAKGRIRANHTGVIDISTSPVGEIGGFQIVPHEHAMGEDLLNARLLTQWMVVGPVSVFGKPLEGTYPLFWGTIHPDYSPQDLSQENWKKRLLRRNLVQVRIGGGSWQPVPLFTGKKDDALLKITHIRIWLSQYPEDKP